MPEVAEWSVADRGQGGRDGTYPRENGDLILQPWEVLEGKGDLIALKSDGSPEFCLLGQPPSPDGRMAGLGVSPDGITLQNGFPLPLGRASYTVSGPMVRGTPLPDAGTPGLAKIPTPAAPTVKKIALATTGYQAYTGAHPGWFFYTLVNLATGAETLPSPPSPPFFGATGQSYRVPLPAQVPSGYGIGLYFAEPGTSTPTAPSYMWRQRVIDPEHYFLPYYDLTGPFRHERLAPTRNETALSSLGVPSIAFRPRYELAAGHYRFLVTQVDESGNEGVAGPLSAEYDPIAYSNRHFEVYRPALSANATGWYLYCLIWGDPRAGDAQNPTQVTTQPSQYYRAFFRNSRVGADIPFPVSQTSMTVTGVITEGLSVYPFDLTQASPPREDKSGIAAPTSAPAAPTSTGAARPDPGRYYAAQVDTVGFAPSLPSNAVPFNLGADEIPRIVFSDPTNRFANGTYLEVGSDGLPFDHTIVQTGGAAYMQQGHLVLETNGAQAGTTPSSITDAVPLDPTKEGSLSAFFTLEVPKSGALAGTAELVLREINSAGTATDTILVSATAVGDVEYYAGVDPAGTVGSPFAWRSDTATHQLLIRSTGASKNNRIRIRYKRSKDHKHRGISRPPSGATADPTAPATIPGAPPAASLPVSWAGPATIVEPPPAPPSTPDTLPVPAPNRPLSSGTVLEHDDYETGVSSGWTQNTSGGGAISTSAVAALSGSAGLRLLKSAGGSLATANLSKSFPATYPFILGGRHDSGLYSKIRVASFVGTGSVRVLQLARPSDGAAPAWLEVSQQPEIAQLTITDNPFQAGNLSLNVGGVNTQVAVNSTPEVSTLTISLSPTTTGSVRINLDEGSGVLVPHDVVLGGTPEVWTLTINGSPVISDWIFVVLDGVAYATYVYSNWWTARWGGYVYADSPATVAARIARTVYPGWNAVAVGNRVTFTSRLPGPHTGSFSFGNHLTQIPATMVRTTTGAPETASQLADRIAASSFPGWVASRGTGTNVVFTANRGGPRVDATYDPRSTGATGSMVVTTPGTIDDKNALAARVRATAFSGWTVTGSGNQATLTSNTVGVRQDASYDPQGTGANGRMVTLQQGTNVDLTAFAQDDFGVVRSKKLFASLTSTQVANADLTVSGAGTDKAVVTIWSSSGSATLQPVFEWEGVSLLNYPVGLVNVGVVQESSASLTWDIHMDETYVTDRGRSYYRQHNARGEFLPRLAYYGTSGQPPLQRVPVKDGHVTVLPGLTYDLSAFVYYDNLPTTPPARPLYVTAHATDGRVTPLGDITGPNGLSGSAGWQEYVFTVTVPADCYALRINSHDVSVGTILIQEIAAPLSGAAPSARRNYTYATSGSYTSTLFIGTPNARQNVFWDRVRDSLGAVVDGLGSTLYASASSQFGPWTPSAGTSDPAMVPENDWLRVATTLTGDGTFSGVLRAGSPFARYRLLLNAHAVPIFLMPDGTEFPGGALFEKLQDWSSKPVVGRGILPSGQPYDPPELFNPVGTIADGGILWVFSREAKRYVEENWRELFRVDQWDEALRVKLSAMPEFERVSWSTLQGGDRLADYVATLKFMWVVESKPLP